MKGCAESAPLTLQCQLKTEGKRWAGIVFAVLVGAAAAVVPKLWFRLGYAGAILLGVHHASTYWLGHDGGWLLLLGLACWATVAVGVRAIRWWLRPDPLAEGASAAQGFWDGSAR
jgi:hypothetical protein